MTRNEYTAQAAMLLFVHKTDKDGISTDVALLGAEILAAKLEEKGCAPWQDAPPVEYQNSMIRSKMPQSPGQVIQFDLPTRKEITAADVQPGAVFTLEDGTKHTVTELTTGAIGGSFVRTSTGSANYEVRGKILEPSVGVFVLQMNAANAAVTPPTA